MKFVILFFAAFLLIAVNAQNSRLENFDIESLLKNDRILNNYLKCILDKGPCTKEGRELKITLPEVRTENKNYSFTLYTFIKNNFYYITDAANKLCKVLGEPKENIS